MSIVDEGCRMNVKYITLVGGGEPLIRSKLVMKIAEKVKYNNIETCLVTNGTLFNEKISKKLVEVEWDNIAFSVNGANTKTDDFLRGFKGAFSKTLESIRILNYWKRKFKTEKPKLTFNPVINKYNYNEIVEMVKLCYKLGIELILFRLVNDDRKNGTFIREEQVPILISQLKEAEELANSLGVTMRKEFTIEDIMKHFGHNKKENNKKMESIKRCPKPFFEVVILPDGTSSPCCLLCEAKYKPDAKETKIFKFLDNIKDKTLYEVWFGKIFENIRDVIRKGKLPEPCNKYCTPDASFRIFSGKILLNNVE
jgi:MoaA/NifB/PqqE/SkfB family radical SAM enzyme